VESRGECEDEGTGKAESTYHDGRLDMLECVKEVEGIVGTQTVCHGGRCEGRVYVVWSGKARRNRYGGWIERRKIENETLSRETGVESLRMEPRILQQVRSHAKGRRSSIWTDQLGHAQDVANLLCSEVNVNEHCFGCKSSRG
jgi:hypothetical protein